MFSAWWPDIRLLDVLPRHFSRLLIGAHRDDLMIVLLLCRVLPLLVVLLPYVGLFAVAVHDLEELDVVSVVEVLVRNKVVAVRIEAYQHVMRIALLQIMRIHPFARKVGLGSHSVADSPHRPVLGDFAAQREQREFAFNYFDVAVCCCWNRVLSRGVFLFSVAVLPVRAKNIIVVGFLGAFLEPVVVIILVVCNIENFLWVGFPLRERRRELSG